MEHPNTLSIINLIINYLKPEDLRSLIQVSQITNKAITQEIKLNYIKEKTGVNIDLCFNLKYINLVNVSGTYYIKSGQALYSGDKDKLYKFSIEIRYKKSICDNNIIMFWCNSNWLLLLTVSFGENIKSVEHITYAHADPGIKKYIEVFKKIYHLKFIKSDKIDELINTISDRNFEIKSKSKSKSKSGSA